MKSLSPSDPDTIEDASGGLGKALLRVLSVLWDPELSKWRFRMGLALALTVGAKFLSVSAPLFLGEAITLASNHDLGATLQPIFMALFLFAAVRYLSSGLPQFRDFLFAPVSQDAMRHLSVKAFGKAQHLSLGFHQTRRSGALNRVIERGSNAMDVILRFLVFNIVPTFIELALAAGVLAVAYSPMLAVIAVATIAVYVLFTVVVTEWRAQQRRSLNKADTELRARSMDSLTNFETVKSFAAEDRETESFNQSFKSYNTRYVHTVQSLSFLNTGQELIMNLGLLAMLGWTGWSVAMGNMEVGALAAVFAMLLNLYRPLNILGWGWREIRQGVIDLEKVFGLMSMVPEVSDAPNAKTLQSVQGSVSFENVDFSHDGRFAGLKDISFDLAPGKHLAIVGPSGSGKSTLLRLLFRFFDVENGVVKIDGIDVRGVTQASLRSELGIVPQDVVLFNDTIKQNILYGRPDASDDELRHAIESAQLADFINSLPDQWETRVGERGLKLSGGEKQRVGLARVVLKDPKILVLDEATSALDSQTEERVQQAISEASRGRTTLTVAHRLSTIRQSDLILVLQDGRVVEKGTHQDLLSQNGLYADMWKKQSSSSILSPEPLS
ncbi:MAG: metal ABC transporter permease [Ponticaulis sp.]|nr:metal ABC transporter permease [Ponticaulis sp.]